MKKLINYLHNDLYLEIVLFVILVLSFCFENIVDVFKGYYEILTSSSILLTDYVYVGGVGATLLNVSTTLAFYLILIKILNVKITGPIYSGLIMVIGFSFFGKNLVNTLPILFGIWVYTKYKKIPMKSTMLSILFSTGLSPIVSYCYFGLGIDWYYALPLGILSGAAVGFLIPAYSSHTIVFHEGYNLYNTGFAMGIISALFYGLLTLFGHNVKPAALYDASHSYLFHALLLVLSLAFILIAIITDRGVFKKYFKMLKTSGRLITDYIRDFSIETVMLNFGILGIVLWLLSIIFQIPFNGIIFGSIIAILGCAAFGLHLRNALYIWIGCSIAIIIRLAVRDGFQFEMDKDMSTIVAFIFATGLAPIAGKYGILYGIIGGFMHMVLTPLMIGLQGGFDLYNNGFSAGFEASILAVCGEKIFNREKKFNAKKSKNL